MVDEKSHAPARSWPLIAALALLTERLPYELLPVQMNCQLNMPQADFRRNGFEALLLLSPPLL